MTVFEIVVILLLQGFFLPIFIRKIKSGTLSWFDFLFIILLDSGLCLFLVNPNLFNLVAKFFGIGRGVDIFIYFAVIILFYFVFRLYFKLEQIRNQITRLNRNISIQNSVTNKDKVNDDAP